MLAMGLRYRRKVPAPAPAANSENSNTINKESFVEAPPAPATAVAPKHEKLKKQQRRHQVRTNQDANEELIREPLKSKAHSKYPHDNQLEHREGTNPAGDVVVVIVSSTSQPDASSPVNEDSPASYMRKKKHKPGLSNQEMVAPVTTKKKAEKSRKEACHPRPQESLVVTKADSPPPVKPTVVAKAEESVAGPEKQQTVIPAVEDTAAVVVSPKSKRQKKKKQNRSIPNDSGEVVAASDKSSDKLNMASPEQAAESATAAVQSAAAPVKEPKQTVEQPRQRTEGIAPEQLRRRKQFSNRKENGPSLMKQLLWKVKAVAKPVEAPAAHVVAVSSVQVSEEQEEEDEEIAYTAEERHSLKLHASSMVKAMSCPVESSSQETQSGSEDESSFIQYSFVSSEDSHETLNGFAISELELLESSFPTPLSLDIVTRVKARHSKVQVHEILLEDFVFKPAELFIAKGDLVVWRVSEQTLGMVEHSLDATLFDTTGTLTRKTSTPLLGPGNGFAWRFDVAGRVDVQCSVYNFHCVVHINDVNNAATKKQIGVVAKTTTTNAQRRKKKAAAKAIKRAAKVAPQPVADVGDEVETRLDNSDSVAVFHPAKDLTRVPEMDAGVCRAVLTQLEEVKAAAEASFIVVGDISCPLVGEAEYDNVEATSVDEPEDDEDGDAVSDGENDEVGDFQQRIIAMLQKSEESQARQRSSFLVKDSEFDAGSAYDFLKRRTLCICLLLLTVSMTTLLTDSLMYFFLSYLQVSRECSLLWSRSCTRCARNAVRATESSWRIY